MIFPNISTQIASFNWFSFQLRGQLRDACKREAGGTELENELPVKKGKTKIIYGIFNPPPP